MVFAIFCFAILFFQTILSDTFVVPGEYPAQNALSSKRESSYPYISGDTFRAIANFIIDEKKIPFDPSLVQEGDIVFLNGDYLDFFFHSIHPRINAHYILLTHNSDYPIPGPFPHILNDQKLIAWFGQNTDRQHPKLFALPIGLANKHWPWGTTHAVDIIKSNVSMYEKKHLLYMNFATYTNMHRPELNTFFEHCSFCYHAPRKPYLNYLEDMAESKFILSPPGTGIDCHRHWEALLVGAIPIIKHSSIDPLFDELPVLLINDWCEITEDFLNNKYTELSSKKFKYDRLYAQYWIDKIKKVQESYLSIHMAKNLILNDPSNKPFVIIIPSYNNQLFYEKNLSSVFAQNYSNYRVIYIDDCSADNTYELVNKYIDKEHQNSRVTLVGNVSRKLALANIYHAIQSCKNEEIIVVLDGDDWLRHKNVLQRLNQEYQDSNTWLTYGQFEYYPFYETEGAQQVPDDIIQNNEFRSYQWVTSHLRTFYAWLFKRIKQEDLMDKNEFFPTTSDLAIMYPMLEMAGFHSHFIPDVLYVYNRTNVIHDNIIALESCIYFDNLIRNKKRYTKLDTKPAELTVVWQVNRETMWETDWLNELLEDFNVTHIDDGFSKIFVDNSLIIITAGQEYQDYFDKLKEMNYTCGIIYLSDENYNHSLDFHKNVSFVFRNYWHKKFATYNNVHQFPLGYKTGFWRGCSRTDIKDTQHREYNWSFAGQISQKPTRQAMIDTMKQIPNYNIHETNCWADPSSLPVDSYQQLLLKTVFVPCPTGWWNLDSYRVYEALECGCIPIVEKKPIDYFGSYFGDHPFITIESWDQAPELINALLADPAGLEERRKACHTWWLNHKEKVKQELRTAIEQHLIPGP